MGIKKGIYTEKISGIYYLCRKISLIAQSDLSGSLIHEAVLIEKLDQKSLLVTDNSEGNQSVMTENSFDGQFTKSTGGKEQCFSHN